MINGSIKSRKRTFNENCFSKNMEVCYWALLFMPPVILHHLLNVFVQLANKMGFTNNKKMYQRRACH
jgi:hypothetical protein